MNLKCSTYWGSIIALFLTLFLGISSAQALPPGGASTVNTPGTSSTVSPGNLKAGDTLSFNLTGFPANEQVYVKVDNGEACPSDSAQGACVVHQQKTDGNGRAQGSFVLSKQLAKGTHTLRFLSTEIVKDKEGKQIGTKGFTNESPAFTISGVNEESSGGNQTNVDPNVINKNNDSSGSQNTNTGSNSVNNSSGQSDKSQGNASSHQESSNNSADTSNSSNTNTGEGTSEEETVYLDADGNEISKEEYDALMAAPDATKKPEEKKNEKSEASDVTASPTASANESNNQTANTSAQENTSKESEVPWFGIIALLIAAVIAGLVFYTRRKNQHQK